MNKSNKFADKLGLGLKFAGNVDFCACNEDFNKKKTEGKNVIFVVFCDVENSYFCCCQTSNANILQISLTVWCLMGISIGRTF